MERRVRWYSQRPRLAIQSLLHLHNDDSGFDDYSENDLENILQVAEKRGCIRRGGNCDYRASDCCVNSACRCNLWGANCRCQRRGIFQKWGK